MRLIPNATLPVSRWPNGAGRKADVLTGDGWLIGFAWLDQDAPFSSLQGYDRTITLVQGPGFTLEVAGGAALVVDALFRPTAFDGGAPTQCRIAGPSRVMNIMTVRGRFRHSLAILQPNATIPTQASVASLLILLHGTTIVTAGGTSLSLGLLDAVELDAPAVVEGSADAVLARLTVERSA